MNKPLLSVITPVYNGEKFILSAINNILSQNYNPIEIIIVDDGSTDSTLTLLNKAALDVSIICQENQGPAAARNRGLAKAKGTYIAFLDHDDLWPANNLIEQATYLDENSHVHLIQGLVEKINLTSGQRSFFSFPLIGSVLFRRTVFDRIGDFDEAMRYGEDADWFFRAFENKLVKVILNKISLYYQIHNTNMTRHEDLVKRGFLQFAKQHLTRAKSQPKDPELNPLNLAIYFGNGPVQLNAVRQFENAK